MYIKNKFGRRPSSSIPKPLPPSRQRAGHRPAHHRVDPAVVFADLLYGMSECKNDFAWACCPFHDDHNPSLCVNLVSGWYRCYSSSCGETGLNIAGFVGRLLALEPREAGRHLEDHYG